MSDIDFRKIFFHNLEKTAFLKPLYIVGGGGCLLKHFANLDADRVTINEDICATAKGYL